MERIMHFVAEWFSFEEMKVQGVSVLTSVWAREWQYKDDIDGLIWEDLSED